MPEAPPMPMDQQTKQTSPGAATAGTGPGADAFARLDELGAIRVTGPDACDFLHRQFTSDLNQVSASHHQLSSWCNPKGRVLACFRVCVLDDGYGVVVRRDLLPGLVKRLRMFVLRSAVSVEDASELLGCIGLAGPNAEETLRRAAGEAPAAVDEAVTTGAVTMLRIAGPAPRFLLLGPNAAMENLGAVLEPLVQRADTAWWELLDIEAGLPVIRAETAEEFVPQMLNLQAVGALSFRKGCYPGQEIVARLQYRGQLKKRLYRCRLQGREVPAPGAPLYGSEAPSGQAAGTVLAARTDPRGGIALQAVIQIEAVDGGALRVGAPDGPAVEVLELPYPLNTR